MAFLTIQDFNLDPYNIPNNDSEDNLPAVIDQEEEDIVLKLLGSSLYQSFIDGLEALPGIWDAETPYDTDQEVQKGVTIWRSLVDGNLNNVPIEGAEWTKVRDDKWLLLQYGDVYTYSGKQYRWYGMAKMLRPYVWFKWVEYDQLRLTGSGIVSSTVENSQKEAPSLPMTRAWNDFGSKAGANCSQINSLYGYLMFKAKDGASVFDGSFDPTFGGLNEYVNTVFDDPGLVNEFDL